MRRYTEKGNIVLIYHNITSLLIIALHLSLLFLSTNKTVYTIRPFIDKSKVSHFFYDIRNEKLYRYKVFFVYRNSTVYTIRPFSGKDPVYCIHEYIP